MVLMDGITAKKGTEGTAGELYGKIIPSPSPSPRPFLFS